MAITKETFTDKIGGFFAFEGVGGFFGNLLMWLVISVIVAGIIGFLVYLWYTRKQYNQRIEVYGLLGNIPRLKWVDKAKRIRVGRVGDQLFFLKKRKRYIPVPTIQIAPSKWWYWEREDGELINIGIENLDEKMKRTGIKFIDSDMRMQRLGIEKNLQYRMQPEKFWQKYGQMIVNFGFYVMVTLMIIILFMQWRKTGSVLEDIASRVSSMHAETIEATKRTTSGGVIPALIFIFMNNFQIWRLRKNRKWH